MSLGDPRPIPQRCGFLILGAYRDLEGWCRVSETIHLLYGGGSDPHRLLNDVKERYLDVFAELRPGVLIDYAKVRMDIFKFCECYARWLGRPLMERLKAEIYGILEEAIDWWGRHHVMKW